MKRAAFPTVVALFAITASTCLAQPIRPLMSRENRLPKQGRLEIGTLLNYAEFDEHSRLLWWRELKRHEGTIEVRARYGLLDNLSAYAALPYGFIDSDFLDRKHDGIRDVRAGLELLAYEHAYEYPYVLPYWEIRFPTGNDDKLLGTGDFAGTFGTAIGTTVHDVYHYVLDGSFDYSRTGNGSEGLFGVAAAFIWDLSDRFSVLVEGKVTEKPHGNDGVPVYFKGGMCYEATENLSIYWYGGSTVNTDENGSGSLKVTYRFQPREALARTLPVP